MVQRCNQEFNSAIISTPDKTKSINYIARWMRLIRSYQDLVGNASKNTAIIWNTSGLRLLREICSQWQTIWVLESLSTFGYSLMQLVSSCREVIYLWGAHGHRAVIASHFVNSKRWFVQLEDQLTYKPFPLLVFPDRVGRVIMDGVVNPLIWTSKPAHMVRKATTFP